MGQGDAIIFSAWHVHRVTPVVEWARWILVGWWQGRAVSLANQ